MSRCVACNVIIHSQDLDVLGRCGQCQDGEEIKATLQALREHEWELCDNHTSLVCNSCGAKTKIQTAVHKHRSGCVYDRLVKSYVTLLPVISKRT
jgi:predicted RNA-binding Zn-ribbon protein involved in translation (DUF1610 family)